VEARAAAAAARAAERQKDNEGDDDDDNDNGDNNDFDGEEDEDENSDGDGDDDNGDDDVDNDDDESLPPLPGAGALISFVAADVADVLGYQLVCAELLTPAAADDHDDSHTNGGDDDAAPHDWFSDAELSTILEQVLANAAAATVGGGYIVSAALSQPRLISALESALRRRSDLLPHCVLPIAVDATTAVARLNKGAAE
jgi:hypothetical protein